ncbi:MAG: ubiquinol-cytochrome c reductase iron-sulfur subunit [Acidimicrobiales bacterium]|nr:Rieske 2Fe-2S domain-containing protein [Actinomycetota bacterium]
MDTGTIFLLAVIGVFAAAFLFLFATARRRDADRALRHLPEEADVAAGDTSPALISAEAAPRSGRDVERSVALERHRDTGPAPAPPAPPPAIPDEETLGVTRRQVLNRGIVASMLVAISGFGGSMLAMLWPSLSGGFGAKVRVGRMEEVLDEIAQTKEPFYYAAGRFYINPYPKEGVQAAKNVTAYGAVIEGYEAGLVAVYQKCPHLGCRVPWCKTSQWFECPCHGSQYNRVGEKKGGPAPRGMDRFRVTVEGGQVTVDTSQIIPGPPIGTNTTGQESEGPHCIGAVSEH